jgi:hypothetical protein
MDMQKALAKGSVSAIAKAYVAQNPDGVTVEQVHQFLFDNGIDKEHRQVYTSMQTLASTGQIGRGTTKGTFVPVANVVVPEKVKAERPVKEPKKTSDRIVKVAVQTHSNEDVFKHLIEQLGEPREFKRDETMGHTYVLLGESPGQYLIDRYRMATGKDPVSWAINPIGPNPAVVFLDE